jgi:hypothetical protein
MGRRSLPQVVIPVPCRVDWNLMTRIDRAGRARFCEKCERLVYDSAAMTTGDLADLIARHEGRRLPCVRLHRRPDGTIVTKDCFAPVLRAGRFLWLKVGIAAVAFWAWALGLRPLVRSVSRRRADVAAAQAAPQTVVLGGMLELAVPSPPDPARLAKLPPGLTQARPRPAVGIRALLPELAPEPPLRDLEVDEELRRRLEREGATRRAPVL